ncbi:hypothetical protein E4U43_008397 [Claviceps pusilla]|uniref:MUC1-Extracellular alpha-1,4-glucan glucosidase n=1 Tax=Claviceps pusilla TaxID=123648 RepID=A0A9P7NB81_9HYPO|nr:hypothetical protein E4U43_008397 [Claviceps pusilla]
MILPSLSVGFISTLIFVSFLSSTWASHEARDDGVVDWDSFAQLSQAVASDLPPNYEPPTYGYDNPPPYQYGTSTLNSVSVSSTPPESISSTIIDSTTVTTTDQSSYSSNTTVSTIDSQTRTTSQAFQSTDEPAPASSKTWVESSVLGITGAPTSTIPEGTTLSTVNTLSTSSESTTSTRISPSLSTASAYPSTNGSIIVSSKSHANNTMTRTTEISTTGSTTSSGFTFESSELPITAPFSSRSNSSSFSATQSNPTTETQIGTGPGVSSSKSSPTQSSLTWHPVFNTTSSGSPIMSSTPLSSGILTNTRPGTETSLWPTSYSQTSASSNSSQLMSSPTPSSALSQTLVDGNPRTKTYFSSQWANSTSVSTQDDSFPGPTEILTRHSSMFSFPTSVSLSTGYTAPNTSATVTTIQQTLTVPLSSGISRNTTTFPSSFSSPLSSPSNSTGSQPTTSRSSWIRSSVLGTGISLTTWKPTVTAPTQSPIWSNKTSSMSTSSAPFQNLTTTTISFSETGPSTRTPMENTTYHTPWTPSTVPLSTVTSIAQSSSQPQPSQRNSTISSVGVTIDPRTSTQSSLVTHQSSLVSVSTGFTSGIPTTRSASNSTYHWPTTIKSSLSSVQSSISTGDASSSETFEPSVTSTMLNPTSVQTLSRTLTSTVQPWPNTTVTVLPTLSSTVPSTSKVVDTSFTSSTSGIVTNTSYVPSSTLWSGTSTQETVSLVTSRWANTTTMDGDPRSTSQRTTTTANGTTLTQSTTTTLSTTLSTSISVPSTTTGLNSTSGRTTVTSSETEATSETTLWPTTLRSRDTTTHDQTPSSRPASTQTRSESTSMSLTNSVTPTTVTSSAPFSTSRTSSRCVPRRKTRSSGLETQSRTAIESQPVLTTLKTLVSTEKSTSEPQASESTTSINTAQPQPTANLANNPNFPWGGDSPIHRHQSVAALGAGIPEEGLWTRWTEKVKDKMRRMVRS